MAEKHTGFEGTGTIDFTTNAQKMLLKVFLATPVLADMSIGEIAIGDGTGAGSEDELFFKPDAAKIVVLQDDGTTRTIVA